MDRTIESVVETAVTVTRPAFRGLAAWEPGIEIVECRLTDGRILDLHNECTLHGMMITCTPGLELRLSFVEDASQDRVEVAFVQVLGLAFVQDDRATTPLWHPSEVETFIGVEYNLVTGGLPHFTLTTIVGDFSFSCRAVEVRHWYYPDLSTSTTPPS